jgi:hypothetical protein
MSMYLKSKCFIVPILLIARNNKETNFDEALKKIDCEVKMQGIAAMMVTIITTIKKTNHKQQYTST